MVLFNAFGSVPFQLKNNFPNSSIAITKKCIVYIQFLFETLLWQVFDSLLRSRSSNCLLPLCVSVCVSLEILDYTPGD